MLANIRRLVGGCQRPLLTEGAVLTMMARIYALGPSRNPYEMVLGSFAFRGYNQADQDFARINSRSVLIRHFRFGEVSMFDSLADRIREDERKEVNNTDRIL